MGNRRRGGGFLTPLYVFAIIWLFSSIAFPLYELWGILMTLGLCSLGAFIAGKASAKRALKKEKEAAEAAAVKAAQVILLAAAFRLELHGVPQEREDAQHVRARGAAAH